MIYIGLDLKSTYISHIAHFDKKYIVDYIPDEYIVVSEGVKTIFGSDFEIQNWMFDGLDVELGRDNIYEDGDHKVIRMVFEIGLKT